MLASPEDESAVRGAVAALAAREDRAIAVTGPWPPFSFCEEVEDHG